MSLAVLLITALSLAMDAFAVAICKGLAMQKFKLGDAVTVAAYFGIFQAIMPFMGFLLASTFADKIRKYDHWVAFVLLALIGLNMVKESFEKDDKPTSAAVSFRAMLPLSVATSIDAMAVGVAFAMIEPTVTVVPACLIIGIITFVISFCGVKIGTVFGTKFKHWAELCGGIILIILGISILLEHLC